MEHPLLLLLNATWLMDVLDEQRRALVASVERKGGPGRTSLSRSG